jgi:hypothetical protein
MGIGLVNDQHEAPRELEAKILTLANLMAPLLTGARREEGNGMVTFLKNKGVTITIAAVQTPAPAKAGQSWKTSWTIEAAAVNDRLRPVHTYLWDETRGVWLRTKNNNPPSEVAEPVVLSELASSFNRTN